MKQAEGENSAGPYGTSRVDRRQVRTVNRIARLPHVQSDPLGDGAMQSTMNGKLAASIEFAREAMSLLVGHELEIAALETVDREGHADLRVYWRRVRPALRVVNE
jgi:hypothetical protein